MMDISELIKKIKSERRLSFFFFFAVSLISLIPMIMIHETGLIIGLFFVAVAYFFFGMFIVYDETLALIKNLHSSQCSSPSQVTSAGSLEQKPAGTVENRPVAPVSDQAGYPCLTKTSDQGAVEQGNRLGRVKQ